MEKKKVYLPYQVKMLMPGEMYKVMDTLFAFQKEDGIITYSKRNCEFLHLDQAIVEQAIQTAIDYKIIEYVDMAVGVHKFRILTPTLEAAKMISLTDIPNKPLFKLSSEITWKHQTTTKELSPEEILGQIERLKKELMKKVRPDENNDNSLPW